jgi:hypothetical protein
LALLLGAVGCATVRPVLQPAQFIPGTNPDVILVVYNDNSEVPVAKPRLVGDTLVGTWVGVGEAVAVPLSQIQRIDAKQRSAKRTALLIAGVAILAASGTYAIVRVTDNRYFDPTTLQDCEDNPEAPGCPGVFP